MPWPETRTSFKKNDPRCHTEEHLKRLSNHWKKEENPMFGKHHSEETKRKISNSNTGKINLKKTHDKMVLDHMKKLIEEGFQVFNPEIMRPDILARKNGKVYAVEIQRDNYPDTEKYNKINFFDDIWWIIIKKEEVEK